MGNNSTIAQQNWIQIASTVQSSLNVVAFYTDFVLKLKFNFNRFPWKKTCIAVNLVLKLKDIDSHKPAVLRRAAGNELITLVLQTCNINFWKGVIKEEFNGSLQIKLLL